MENLEKRLVLLENLPEGCHFVSSSGHAIMLGNVIDLEIENEALKADILTIKKTILTVVRNLGMLNPDDTIKEKVDKRKLFGNVYDIIMGNGKGLMQNFDSLGDLIPLIEKYKDLE